MPEITVTEEQRDRLESVRADVEAAFVDTYGHARIEDAVEYLLDTYTPPDERGEQTPAAYERIETADYSQLQRIASDVPGVPGSGIDADEMRGKLLTELGAADLAERLADGSSPVDDAADRSGDERSDDAGDDPGDASDDAPASGQTADDGEGTADGSADPEPATDGDTAGGVLSAANRLLAEHGNKWRESDAGDEPYEVDLPDGSTTGARTKDDVRQLLFRHY